MSAPTVISEKVLEYAIVANRDGNIIWNAFMQDSPVTRRQYSDGTVDVIETSTGKVIMPPYDPRGDDIPVCTHCGERPW